MAKKDATYHKTSLSFMRQARQLDAGYLKEISGILFVETLTNNGQEDKDQALLEEAVSLDPNYTPALYALASTFEDQGRAGEAYALYLQVLEKEPGYVAANMNAGNICFHRLQFDSAISHYDMARKADTATPKEIADALHNMGVAYGRNLQPVLAQRYLQESLAVMNDASARFSLFAFIDHHASGGILMSKWAGFFKVDRNRFFSPTTPPCCHSMQAL